jgi:hypothetical protein
VPCEHRGRLYRDLLRTHADIERLELAFRSENDPWLRKILAEGLEGKSTGIDAQEIEALLAMSVTQADTYEH